MRAHISPRGNTSSKAANLHALDPQSALRRGGCATNIHLTHTTSEPYPISNLWGCPLNSGSIVCMLSRAPRRRIRGRAKSYQAGHRHFERIWPNVAGGYTDPGRDKNDCSRSICAGGREKKD